ncbi:hypothetical protein LCGC14_1675840 [marine sediment metagenome]|uniref:Uncharacterized protein n=1 Tax=marine sediment metagenome TaxID=412755 RepID=A0A0F9ICF2_9ZZZZ
MGMAWNDLPPSSPRRVALHYYYGQRGLFQPNYCFPIRIWNLDMWKRATGHIPCHFLTIRSGELSCAGI